MTTSDALRQPLSEHSVESMSGQSPPSLLQGAAGETPPAEQIVANWLITQSGGSAASHTSRAASEIAFPESPNPPLSQATAPMCCIEVNPLRVVQCNHDYCNLIRQHLRFL